MYPVVWILSASINPVDNLQATRLIPENANLDNFRELFDSDLTPFMTWLRNSCGVMLLVSIFMLARCARSSSKRFSWAIPSTSEVLRSVSGWRRRVSLKRRSSVSWSALR